MACSALRLGGKRNHGRRECARLMYLPAMLVQPIHESGFDNSLVRKPPLRPIFLRRHVAPQPAVSLGSQAQAERVSVGFARPFNRRGRCGIVAFRRAQGGCLHLCDHTGTT